jgi:hypothetical protein
MYPKPQFIQGMFVFEGAGLTTPTPLGAAATYRVPADKRAQIVYVRAGNAAGSLVCLTLLRDGQVMRHFPIGAHQSVHVPLAMTEDVFPESQLELVLSAPKGVSGVVVVDVGLFEIA